MPILGITGGIATGKSSFTSRLSRCLQARTIVPAIFDADAIVRDLLTHDLSVQEVIARQFGTIDRKALREKVFADTEARKALEAILHPIIRARWTVQTEAVRRNNGWLLLDIPLLYEAEAETECDAVIVVACSREMQIARIVARGLTSEMAAQMIAAQASLAEKIAKADHVIWNDAPEARLDEQAELFAEYLTTKRFFLAPEQEK